MCREGSHRILGPPEVMWGQVRVEKQTLHPRGYENEVRRGRGQERWLSVQLVTGGR